MIKGEDNVALISSRMTQNLGMKLHMNNYSDLKLFRFKQPLMEQDYFLYHKTAKTYILRSMV